MKHLKLFFALFAMLALGVGNAWAEDVTFSWAGSATATAGSTDYVVTNDPITLTFGKGTAQNAPRTNKEGSVRMYANTTLTISCASGNITGVVFTPTNSTYNATKLSYNGIALTSDEWTLPSPSNEVILTASAAARFETIVVTYTLTSGGETPGEGGGDPEEPTPGTGGEALSYTWDLSTNSYSAVTTDQVTWSSTDVNMVLTKESSSTNANNYLGGTNAHTRVYKSQKITFTPEENVTITSIEITATSSTYAGNFAGATWSNGTASTNNTIVTVIPTNGANAVSCTIGTATRATGVTVHYTKSGSGSTETVVSLTDDQLKWSAATAEATMGASNTFPTLTNTLPVSVTYESSTPATATIDATSGAITLVDPGTTTISAKFAGGEVSGTTYADKTVTYALTVLKAPATPTDNVYIKVTSDEGLTNGEYLIVYEDATNTIPAPVAFNGALATKKLDVASNNIEVSIASNTIAGNTDIDAATFTINTTAGTIQTKDGYYIGQTSNANGLATSTTPEYTNTISIENDGSATIISKGGAYLRYNSASNQLRFRYYKSSSYTDQKAIALYKKVDPNEIIEPQFKLAAGEYYGTQSVEITCATTDAKIYYTLDETEPTSASTEYTGAISIASTTTVKAIAVKGENSSAVVSATYTILAPLATMQEIFDKATDATQSVHIKFNDWVISGVVPGKDGKPSSNAYITDGSKGFIIYNKDGHGFNVGDKLSGTVVCDLTRYNGSAEVVGLTSSTEGLTVSTGGVVTPVAVADKSTLSGVNTGAVIKITGVCETKNINSRDYFYVGGVQLYNSLFAYENPTVGSKYNVTGVYVQYNDVPEVLPRSAADIEEIIDLPTATISIANITMEVGQEKAIEATITPDAAQSTVQYAITSGNEYITLNGTTITAVAAGTATITATIAEVAGEYYGATKTFNVTVKPQDIAVLPFTFMGGKTDIENTLGMSQEGLGNDYSGTTNLRFDDTNDLVVIHFDSEPGQLSYEIKGNSFSGGTFSVQQSADGSTYTEVVTYTELGDAATKEHELAAESRYVKFIYTEKSSGNVGLGNISITKADHRQDAGLVWNPATVSLTVGDAFTAPTFSNPNTLTGITFASDNEALATVTNAGVISLVSGKTGIATITATYAGDATYKAAEVTCTITVDHKSEDIVILAKCKDQYYALVAENLKSNVLKALPVEYVGGKIYNVETEDQASIIWKRSVVDGKTTFKNGENYLSAVNSADLNLATEACEWVFDGNMYKIEGSTRTILYYTSTGGFKNYSTQNISKDGVNGEYSSAAITVAPVFADGDAYHRTVTKDNFGTLCIPFGSNVGNYSGAEFYEISWMEMDGTTPKGIWLDQVNGALTAGKPYIFKATADEIAIVGDGTTAASPIAGVAGLVGTFALIQDIETSDPSNTLEGNYMISGNQFLLCPAGCWLNANRAYIDATIIANHTTKKAEIPGRRRVCLGETSENEATGFENIVAPEGQAVKAIVNGQLIIIRDGVKYNVQGQKL